MASFFNEILIRPIFNLLIVVYQFASFHDLGIAIILLTLLIRLILFPIFHSMAKYQKLASKLQKEAAAIQKKHKDNRQEQTKALMEMYKAHKVNPFTPIISLAIQIPILIALYQVLRKTFSYHPIGLVYSFVSAPAVLNHTFLGLIDLSSPSKVIILLAAALQYIQAKVALPEIEENMPLEAAEKMARNMAFIGPVITIVIFWNLPSALGLYWVAFSVFSICHQLIVNYGLRKDGRIHKSSKGAN